MKEKIVSIENHIPTLKQKRKKKAKRRLLFVLAALLLLLVIFLYMQSPYSKVNAIHVQGEKLMTRAEVIAQSGLERGAGVWSADKSRAEQLLLEDDRIKEADVSLGFPNDIVITVVEQEEVAYAVRKGRLYPVLQNGEILNEPVSGAPLQLPVLYGFKESEALDLFARAAETLPAAVFNMISEVHYEPEEKEPFHVRAYMTDGFEVSAVLSTFAEKMVYYPSISAQLDPNVKGVIHLEVGSYFEPYNAEEQQESNGNSPEQQQTP